MIKTILSITLSMSIISGPNVSPAPGEVPFLFANGLVVVEARINGSVPVHVALSTGSEHSIIDFAMLEKYKLKSFYAPDGPVTGRNDRIYTYAKVSGVGVGDSKSKDLDMRFGSLAHVSQAAGREVFAALGADFFEGQIVQLDFKKKVISFLEKSPPDAQRGKNAGSGGNAGAVLRMEEKPSSMFQRTFLLPVVGDVMFNGQKVKLLLDTGRATSLVLSPSAAKKAGLTPPEENGPPREDKVKSLRLGGDEMTDVPVVLYAKGTEAEKIVSRHGAIAGTLFLQNFITTFDFRNKLVVLERF